MGCCAYLASFRYWVGLMVAVILAGSTLSVSADAPEASDAGVSLPPIPELPRSMAWSAYNLGTTGYNQAVGIAKMMKDRHRVTLRIIQVKTTFRGCSPCALIACNFPPMGLRPILRKRASFSLHQSAGGRCRFVS